MKAQDVTGLILAGGESRRFGSDKALHLVDGRPMIEHVYNVVTGVVGDVFISVSDPSVNTGLPAEHLPDIYPDAGPLAGMHAGLLRCRSPWLLAAACDMPFLTADVLGLLLAARTGTMGPVVARSSDGQLHPLCALYPRDMLIYVEAALAARRFALHALLERASFVTEVAVPANAVRNINRPQDLTAPKQYDEHE
jgi:molybdopterin-guanine dinucleotide biosynthesis protein A